jgi:hypothetical protein
MATSEFLDSPTAAEMIEFLKQVPPDTPVRIRDPDTGWTISKIHYEHDKEALWFTGEYREMESIKYDD